MGGKTDWQIISFWPSLITIQYLYALPTHIAMQNGRLLELFHCQNSPKLCTLTKWGLYYLDWPFNQRSPLWTHFIPTPPWPQMEEKACTHVRSVDLSCYCSHNIGRPLHAGFSWWRDVHRCKYCDSTGVTHWCVLQSNLKRKVDRGWIWPRPRTYNLFVKFVHARLKVTISAFQGISPGHPPFPLLGNCKRWYRAGLLPQTVLFYYIIPHFHHFADVNGSVTLCITVHIIIVVTIIFICSSRCGWSNLSGGPKDSDWGSVSARVCCSDTHAVDCRCGDQVVGV